MSVGSDFSTLITELKDNLQSKGISDAEYDSVTGIRGLVARIPEIQSFTDGLLLWSNYDVLQSGSTINLNALLLDDGLGVSGESVIFESDIPINTITLTSGDHTINRDYVTFDVSSMSDGSEVEIGTSVRIVYITKNAIMFYGFNDDKYDALGDTNIQIKDNILTYDSSKNGLTNVDISKVSYSGHLDDDLTVYEYFYEKVNTNSNGIASTTYTGTAAGIINFSAKSGSLVSKTYELIDGTFVDKGLSTDYNDSGWTNYNLVTPFDRTDGTKLEQTDSSGGGWRFRTPSTTTDICIELDFKIVNASDSILSFRNSNVVVKTVYGSSVSAEANTWTHIKITVKDDKYYLNDSPNGTALSEWTRIYLQSYNGNSLKYKNFVIYPI